MRNLLTITAFFCLIFCNFCTQKPNVQEITIEEIKQKDSTIESIISTMLSDEVLTLSKAEYEYFFKRLEALSGKGGRIKFGEHYFNVAQQDNEYVFEEPNPDLNTEDHFYFKLTKKFQADYMHGEIEILEVQKLPDLHENE